MSRENEERVREVRSTALTHRMGEYTIDDSINDTGFFCEYSYGNDPEPGIVARANEMGS